MASAILLFLAVMLSSICSGALAEKLLSVECKHAVGVVGQTIKISCSFKSSSGADQGITVAAVSIFKSGQEDPVFTFLNNIRTGDARFKLPSENNPSLELTSAAVTDEGEYDYELLTNNGIIKDGAFRISVTAKYSQPAMNSWPEKIEDGSNIDLYCNASGGYPAGVIRWFDSTNTDWTKSATLETKEGKDKLLQMSSKLTFTSIDSSWAPFRCVVLNSKLVQEGENEFQPVLKEGSRGASTEEHNILASTKIAAPVVVIGSLLVGLLLLILLRGRCGRRGRYTSNDEPDVEKAMYPKEPNGKATEVKT